MATEKYCGSCGKHTLHNEMKLSKTDQKYRCTYCGHPISTNPAKRESQEFIRRKQVTKLGRLVY